MEAAIIIASASLTVQVFAEIRNYLEKRKEKKIIAYPEQEKMLRVISALNTYPELKEKIEVIEFFENYKIIFTKDKKIGVATKETAENDTNEIIEKMKVPEHKNEINLLPLEEYQEYVDILLTKYVAKEIADVSSKLNKDYKRLLSLSIRVETLYKEGKLEEVDNLKSDITKIDHDIGLKFCNLYLRGYLKKFISSTLYGADEKSYNKQIKRFIEEDCKSIFFISNIYQIKMEYLAKTIHKVNYALNKNDVYVAVHSLRSARNLAKKVIAEIKMPENSDYNEPIEIRVGNELSKIWYRDAKGLQMLILIKDTLIGN